MLALAQPIEAKILYTPANVQIGNSGVLHYQLDLNHDGVKDFSFSYPGTSHATQTAALIVQALDKTNGVAVVGLPEYPADFAAGKGDGPGRKFISARQQIMALWFISTYQGIKTYRGNWLNVQNRYLGLKFLIKGKVHYGWARLNVAVHGSIQGTLTGYAYETIPNKPIITGKTKGPDVITLEPGSLGALAAGVRSHR